MKPIRFFKPENLQLAKAILARYPPRFQSAALVPLLDLAQRQHGTWIPPTAMYEIASLAGVSIDYVHSLILAYPNDFFWRPKKPRVRICNSWMCQQAAKEQGNSNWDSQCRSVATKYGFDVENTGCLGNCFQGPAMWINDKIYGVNTKEKLVDIMEALTQKKN